MRLILLILVISILANCNSSGNQNTKTVQEPVSQLNPKMPSEGCVTEAASRLVTQRKVSEIFNLIEDRTARGYENECIVEFDITVDSKTYHLEETEIGLEQMNSVCFYARERARLNLLSKLGGEYQAETVTVCRNPEN